MPYSPIIAPADLKTQMYPEVQAIITRSDATIAPEAIDIAISEVKMYLFRYDTLQLFGSEANNISATFTDKFLNSLVKTIAVWHLLRLANPNTDLSLAKTWYDDTVSSLKKIASGLVNPDGWPYKDTTGETAPQGDSVYSRSNPRRRNHF